MIGWVIIIVIVILILTTLIGFIYLYLTGGSSGTASVTAVTGPTVSQPNGSVNATSTPGNSVQNSNLHGGTDVLQSGGNVIYNAKPYPGTITLFIPPSPMNTIGTIIQINNNSPYSVVNTNSLTVVPQSGVTVVPPGPYVVGPNNHMNLVAIGTNSYWALINPDTNLYLFKNGDPALNSFLKIYNATATSYQYILQSVNGYTYNAVTFMGNGANVTATSTTAAASMSGNTFTFPTGNGKMVSQVATTNLPFTTGTSMSSMKLGQSVSDFFSSIGNAISSGGSSVINTITAPITNITNSISQGIQSVEQTISNIGNAITSTANEITDFFPAALKEIQSFGQTITNGLLTAFNIAGIVLAVLFGILAMYFLIRFISYLFTTFAAVRVATSNKI